ncbi:hypothetical protein [Pelagicoccus sp. SDUM812002]|uniref:SMP-30/gluconolactonase/LRE family protein n=1 Tax=Pelagicoccus sp. SDUM812002 TaxID=3041266 RepID=UPI0028108AE0|nr:hypothetical protein [Pelagicoccus sp. SDUM812002]MDQ8187182.1 hypothetical protein [Pelagicoccus sp. SDUM812002]
MLHHSLLPLTTFAMVASAFLSAQCHAAELSLLWEIKNGVRGPESIVYDSKRDCLYVSNYNVETPNEELGTDSVGKISRDGELIDTDWLDGLSSPLGMEIHDDHLYVVERGRISVFDIALGESIELIQTPNSVFLNDLTLTPEGTIFATDPRANAIYRITDGKLERWASGDQFTGVNGIMDDAENLLVGTSGDAALIAINKQTKSVSILARFEGGILDGIQKADTGYFVSLYHGELFRIEPGNPPKRILDTRERGLNCANFLYINDTNSLYIPELRNNSISAYGFSETE